MTTGLSFSPLFEHDRLIAGMELPPLIFPLGTLTLEGEQDDCLGLALGRLSIEDDLKLGAPGLTREAEDGLSGNDVLKFGGASREKPGISEGFQGLDLRVGEIPRDGTTPLDIVGADLEIEGVGGPDGPGGPGLVVAVEELDFIAELVVGPDLVTDEDRLGGIKLEGKLDGVDDLLVGVVDLDTGLLAGGMDDLDAGVEDLAGDDDLGGAAAELEGTLGRAVGVEDLEGLDAVCTEGRPLGVEGLEEVTLDPPDDEGLLIPKRDEFKLEWVISCAEAVVHLEEVSGGFANRDFKRMG